MGHEADAYYGYGYEEQELGVRGPAAAVQGQQHQHQQQYQQQQQQQQQHQQQYAAADTAYSGGGYSNVNLSGIDDRRGRTVSRDLEPSTGGRNPFDDDAAEPSNISLRGVSPRPIDTSVGGAKAKGVQNIQGGSHESPTSERRSIFRENV